MYACAVDFRCVDSAKAALLRATGSARAEESTRHRGRLEGDFEGKSVPLFNPLISDEGMTGGSPLGRRRGVPWRPVHGKRTKVAGLVLSCIEVEFLAIEH